MLSTNLRNRNTLIKRRPAYTDHTAYPVNAQVCTSKQTFGALDIKLLVGPYTATNAENGQPAPQRALTDAEDARYLRDGYLAFGQQYPRETDIKGQGSGSRKAVMSSIRILM